MHTNEWDYYKYSYSCAIILIGFVVNLVVIVRNCYDRRRNRGVQKSTVHLPFTILTCFIATSNILLLITRDLGHLLETATSGDWKSTTFVCKFYKFWTFLAYHSCSYSICVMVACTCWYIARPRSSSRIGPKQNRIGMLVAVCWALTVAFCAPFYHVSGTGDVEEIDPTSKPQILDGKRKICYTIRPYDPNNTDLVFVSYPYFLITTILIVPTASILLCYLIFGKKILAQRRKYNLKETKTGLVRLIQYVPQPGDVDEVDDQFSDGDESTSKLQRSTRPKSRAEGGTKHIKSKAGKNQPKLEVIDVDIDDIDTNKSINYSWKICRIAALLALTYAVCWLPYAIVFLLVARGDVHPDTLSVTIPSYMLFLLYPIISGVCLIV